MNAHRCFESVLKTICDARVWKHSKKAGANELIRIVFDKGLLPPDQRGHFEAFWRALEKGLPVLRNDHGGHGQGSTAQVVPEHLAAYAIHITAANVLFLVKAHQYS